MKQMEHPEKDLLKYDRHLCRIWVGWCHDEVHHHHPHAPGYHEENLAPCEGVEVLSLLPALGEAETEHVEIHCLVC